MAKERKISDENKAFYKLGFLNGEAQLQETINKLREAYAFLFKELTRLDREEPLAGVLLDYKTINSVIKALKKSTHKRKLIAGIEAAKKKAYKRDALAVLVALEQMPSD